MLTYVVLSVTNFTQLLSQLFVVGYSIQLAYCGHQLSATLSSHLITRPLNFALVQHRFNVTHRKLKIIKRNTNNEIRITIVKKVQYNLLFFDAIVGNLRVVYCEHFC